MLVGLFLAIGSYFLGTLPQVYWLGRLRHLDLRGEPDLHISLWQKGGRFWGFLGILGDLIKGLVPIWVGRSLGLEPWPVALAGLAAVLGQMWPLFLGATGSRGNSTGLAMALVLAPQVFLWALLPLSLGFLSRLVEGSPSRGLPLGIAVALVVLPIASLLTQQPLPYTLVYLGLFLTILLRRLTVGLRADLAQAKPRGALLLNRILFDRSS